MRPMRPMKKAEQAREMDGVRRVTTLVKVGDR